MHKSRHRRTQNNNNMIPTSHKKTIIGIVVAVLIITAFTYMVQKNKTVEVVPVEVPDQGQLQSITTVPVTEVPAGVTTDGKTMTTAPVAAEVAPLPAE